MSSPLPVGTDVEDPELQAVVAMERALRDLDRPAAIRVLSWADARYGAESGRMAIQGWMEGFTKALEALDSQARKRGVTSDELVRVIEAILGGNDGTEGKAT